MTSPITTTEEDFEFFKAECEAYLELMNLTDWSVDYFHDDIDGLLGETDGNLQQHHATITLGKEWPAKYYNRDEISRTALHEVLEVMLMDLRILANTRFVTENEIDHAAHMIIQRLSNMFIKLLKEVSDGSET